MNASAQSEELLHALSAGADPRKARSLRLIHAICVEQRDRGSDDYTIATIGRLSAERGGPAAGAIRNKTGEAYRALIKVFADSAPGRTRRPSGDAAAQIDLILEGVADPVLRTRLGLLLAELKATRAQLLATRHLASQTATLDLEQPSRNRLPPSPETELTSLEVRALENAISNETLDHWGCGRTKAGESLPTLVAPCSRPASSPRSARPWPASSRAAPHPEHVPPAMRQLPGGRSAYVLPVHHPPIAVHHDEASPEPP